MLSPDELKITWMERMALLYLIPILRNEQVQLDMGYAVGKATPNGDHEHIQPDDLEDDRHTCHTCGCIGGWMHLLMTNGLILPETLKGEDVVTAQEYVSDVFKNPVHPLRELFYDRTGDDVTPAQAVRAIENFLATGNPNWPSICPPGPEDPDYGEDEY